MKNHISAFPVNTGASPNSRAYEPDPGMDLRDWFAGQALAGIIANSENVPAGAEPTNSALSRQPVEFSGWLARISYMVADAMMAERTRTEEQP